MGIRSRVDFIIPPRRAVWQRRKGDLCLYRLIRILPAAIYALIRVGNAVETGRICRPNALDRYISVVICRRGAKRHPILHRIFGVQIDLERRFAHDVVYLPAIAALLRDALPRIAALNKGALYALQDVITVRREHDVRRVELLVVVSALDDAVLDGVLKRRRTGIISQIADITFKMGIISQLDLLAVQIHLNSDIPGVPAPLGGVSHILRDRHLVQLLIRVSLTVQRRLPPSKGIPLTLRRTSESRRRRPGISLVRLIGKRAAVNAVLVNYIYKLLLKLGKCNLPVQVPA